ncbi:LysR family transcriptional regulator [Enterobacter cloacae subsp. cloacae]|uniref:helix-turn-helix domain-containing protein n=1 Tax=Enterobacter cloacae TaxID=550 RepID=UPI000735DA6A|nr:LysR family transcriptional regulator [Enterobacter cloacae]KTH90461.1 LysR family transcriptional regulator [Enterobacter cloacae subsp. cloacae]
MTKNYSRANTGIDLNLIPVFIEVVRCGSMAKASVRLEMSRPAVSLALKRFSQLFAEPLFIRKGLYLEPTEKSLTLTHQLEILLGNIHDNISAINLSENNTLVQNVPGSGNIMRHSASSV